MDQKSFESYLSDRYEDQIDWYDRKAAWNQTLYRWLQWTIIGLAALSPILIELTRDLQSGPLPYLPTVTTAVVAILTAGLKTFQYQEHWINYRTTCETLRKERYFYEAGLGDYRDSRDKEALFVERVEALISRENTMWVSAQSKPEGESQG